MRWSLFFLIAVGRGKMLEEILPAQSDLVMNWVYDIAKEAPFAVKTTEAPHYRRVALNRMRGQHVSSDALHRVSVYNGFGIRDGHGIMFISNTGDICPAGFLPLAAGNIRTSNVRDVYRNSELFRSLHDPGRLQGKCSRCEYREICGGSRARAFAYTGNVLESDPICPYEPVGNIWIRAEAFA